MPPEIHVHLLPDHADPTTFAGGTAVIVDILRASTTILTALNNGAAAVRPCLSVEQAVACRDKDADTLLGGERGGVMIKGFDLGNSPAVYDAATVGNRTIAFTTTNGTKALLHSTAADEILIGAFCNVRLLAQHLCTSDHPLHVVCAGTDGAITGEDALFAGCLIDHMERSSPQRSAILTDTARMTLGWWQHETNNRPLAESLQLTQGGRNLLALNYDSDVRLAAQLDNHPVLAGYDAGTGTIVRLDRPADR